MKNIIERIRALFFVIIILAAMSLCCVKLMKIQIVDGESYVLLAQSTSIGT